MATMASICWGMSHLSFDASNDDRFPNQMQRVFGFWGNYWAQVAIAVQGDAFQWWLDFCHETAQLQLNRSFRNVELLTAGIPKLQSA